MPIPNTRQQLLDQMHQTFDRLSHELDANGARAGQLPCTNSWNIKGLLAVRAWWATQVIDWVKAGQSGASLTLPAPGYRWTETPALNETIARKSSRESYPSVQERLAAAHARAVNTAGDLSDRELLHPGIFEWTGKRPVARWIALNTATQYASARTLIRKAVRAAGWTPRPASG